MKLASFGFLTETASVEGDSTTTLTALINEAAPRHGPVAWDNHSSDIPVETSTR